jgi:hypothetical protein
VALEGVHRLGDEGDAVGQEKHAFDPVAAHEQVAEGDHRACLTRARRHHQQRLAVVVALEGLDHTTDGARLVMTLDDLQIDRGFSQRPTRRPALDQQF